MDRICRNLDQPAALQLIRLLGEYAQVAATLDNGWDDEAYSTAATLFDQIHMHASELSGVQVAWIEVLISRAEFVHALWAARNGRAPGTAPSPAGHLGAVARLRRRCESLYAVPH